MQKFEISEKPFYRARFKDIHIYVVFITSEEIIITKRKLKPIWTQHFYY